MCHIRKSYIMIKIQGIVGEDVTMLDVIAQMKKETGDIIIVEIDSPGGYAEEGLNIYRYLKNQKKKVRTVARNCCGSIASVIFMAGSERVACCDIFIHNPFLGDVYAPVLTREDLEEAADYLAKLTKEINDIYRSVSGVDKEALQILMDQETAIPAKKAVEIGIATRYEEGKSVNRMPVIMTRNKVAAKALIRNSSNINTKTKKKMSKIQDLIKKAKDLLTGKAKNETYADVDGNEFTVEIPEDREERVPQVGDMASPDGTFVLEDGVTIVIENGAITEIREEGAQANIEQLQSENQELRQMVQELTEALEKYAENEKKEEKTKTLNVKRSFKTKNVAAEEENPVKKAMLERLKAKNKKGGE